METFNNLAELKTKVAVMDRLEEKKIFVGDSPEDSQEIRTYKAVWNKNQGQLEAITSLKSYILPHDEIFGQFINILGNLGVSVKGSIQDDGGRAVVEMTFHDLKISDDTDEGVDVGVRLVNSYDNGFSGQMFAFRNHCSNGMFLGKTFGDRATISQCNSCGKVSCRHTGKTMPKVRVSNKEYSDKIEAFLKEIIESNEKLKLLVSDCMKESLEWDLALQLIDKFIPQKKHKKALSQKLQEMAGKDKLTRWDVYNALTSYATHGKNLGEGLENYIQSKAQQLLSHPAEKLVVMVEEKE